MNSFITNLEKHSSSKFRFSKTKIAFLHFSLKKYEFHVNAKILSSDELKFSTFRSIFPATSVISDVENAMFSLNMSTSFWLLRISHKTASLEMENEMHSMTLLKCTMFTTKQNGSASVTFYFQKITK